MKSQIKYTGLGGRCRTWPPSGPESLPFSKQPLPPGLACPAPPPAPTSSPAKPHADTASQSPAGPAWLALGHSSEELRQRGGPPSQNPQSFLLWSPLFPPASFPTLLSCSNVVGDPQFQSPRNLSLLGVEGGKGCRAQWRGVCARGHRLRGARGVRLPGGPPRGRVPLGPGSAPLPSLHAPELSVLPSYGAFIQGLSAPFLPSVTLFPESSPF